ncbi:phytoene desaturase family protein [Streptomyces sp. NPDC007971]|uniref:phytoene desaturase family protein n=1 Tax=Streptomyces sp. NPDC007971 TaxID=3364799 RepID=UPI0036EAC528
MATVGMLPVARLLKACGLSPLACAVILGESGDYGAPPSRAPIALHAGLLDLFIGGGAYYPQGGGQVFAGHLIDVIRTHGGQVRTKAAVRQILVEEGRAVGVRLADGETIRAAAVVSNADIKRTCLELVGREHLSARTVGRVEKYRMALPFFSVYLGLDIDLAERLPNTTYWCHPGTDTERAYRNAYSGELSGELPVFLTSAATKDPGNPRSAPPGHSTLEVMTLVSPDPAYWGAADASPAGLEYRSSPEYQKAKERLTEALIDRAGTVVPRLREHIVWREASTPLTQERFTRSTGGACYGLELATDQIGPRRPGARTELPGLFLTGASTVWGPGVSGAVTGGVGTAGAVLGAGSDGRGQGGPCLRRPCEAQRDRPGLGPPGRFQAQLPDPPTPARRRAAGPLTEGPATAGTPSFPRDHCRRGSAGSRSSGGAGLSGCLAQPTPGARTRSPAAERSGRSQQEGQVHDQGEVGEGSDHGEQRELDGVHVPPGCVDPRKRPLHERPREESVVLVRQLQVLPQVPQGVGVPEPGVEEDRRAGPRCEDDPALVRAIGRCPDRVDPCQVGDRSVQHRAVPAVAYRQDTVVQEDARVGPAQGAQRNGPENGNGHREHSDDQTGRP